MKKVLMLTLFPSEGNGSATVVRDLSAALSAETEVMVFYIDVEQVEIAGLRSHTMVVDDFPVLRTHPKSPTQRPFIQLSTDEIDAYLDRTTEACLSVVRSFEPDLIHVHHGWLGAEVARRVKKETGTPYVVQFHGTELEVRADYEAQNPETFAYLHRIVRAGLKKASTFSTISPTEEANTKAFAEAAGLTVPVCMIPNGYDENIFEPRPGDVEAINAKHAAKLAGRKLDPTRPIVLYVGRFAGFKGIEHLVRAAPLYAATGAQTVLCGDGDLRDGMIALSKELGSTDTHFFGHVDHFDDLPALYCAADVLIVPSRGEPFGLVAIEAMGCGTPVIGSRSGALPYVLSSSPDDEEHGRFALTPTGILVPFGEPQAIADAVVYAIESGFKAKMAERISEQVLRDFSVTAQTARIRTLYDSVLEASTDSLAT